MKISLLTFCIYVSCSLATVIAQLDSLINNFENELTTTQALHGDAFSGLGEIYDTLAILHFKEGNYKLSDSLFHKGFEIYIQDDSSNQKEIIDCLYNIGNTKYFQIQYNAAAVYYARALKRNVLLFGERHTKSIVLNNALGLSNQNLYQFDKAEEYFKNSIKLSEELNDSNSRKIVKPLRLLANLYYQNGKYYLASKYFYRAKNIYERNNIVSNDTISHIYEGLGLCHSELGEFNLAKKYLLNCLDIRQNSSEPNHFYLSNAYHNLASYYNRTGEIELSLLFMEQALNNYVAYKPDDAIRIASIYYNIGILHYFKNDFQHAENYYNKAIDIWKNCDTDIRHHMRLVTESLGILDQRNGDLESAKTKMESALNIGFEIFDENNIFIANSMQLLAIVLSELNEDERSLELIEKAVKLKKDHLGVENRFTLMSQADQASIIVKQKEYAKADSIWQEIIPTYGNMLKSNLTTLDGFQRIQFLDLHKDQIMLKFLSYAVSHGSETIKQTAIDFLLNMKSLALDYEKDIKQIIHEVNDVTLMDQYHELKELNKLKLVSNPKEQKEKKIAETLDIVKREEDIINKIYNHPEVKSKLLKPNINWQDLRDVLSDNEVCIEFFEAYDNEIEMYAYYAVIIKRDLENPIWIKLVNSSFLSELITKDERKIPLFMANRKNRKLIYEELWLPIEEYLENVKSIHLSPSGLMNRVPFDAMQNGYNEYLGDIYNFHNQSALKNVLNKKSPELEFQDIVLLGDIQYDIEKPVNEEPQIEILSDYRAINKRDKANPLPHTLKEINEIKKIGELNGTNSIVLKGDRASEDSLYHFSNDYAPDILHFATHGVFLSSSTVTLENPKQSDYQHSLSDNSFQRSSLFLSGANEKWMKGSEIFGVENDGILTAFEVSNMDYEDTKLVVMSACSSGLGDIHNTEGVFGLQRAFKIAGVDYVVSSLWEVDDLATKELMVSFYKYLLQSKLDPSEALVKAKYDLRVQGFEPKDWAAFTLIE